MSDVLPTDFNILLDSLLDPTFFTDSTTSTDKSKAALEKMVLRWKSYVAHGQFKLSVPSSLTLTGHSSTTLTEDEKKEIDRATFWTSGYSFREMKERQSDLVRELQKSDLVIFKGDLNYRKLVGSVLSF